MTPPASTRPQGNRLSQRGDVTGVVFTDDETAQTMARVLATHDYLLDPHTAVGWSAIEKELGEDSETYGIVLGTAHPAKFGEVVEKSVDRRIDLPESLARHLKKTVKSEPKQKGRRALRSRFPVFSGEV